MYNTITSTIKKLIVLAIVASFAIGAAVGYAYKSHKVSIKEVKSEATQETAEKIIETVVTVTDKAGMARLENNLAAARMRASALELQIKAYERENLQINPDNAINCALPDGLRDQINLDLTRSTGKLPDPVRK